MLNSLDLGNICSCLRSILSNKTRRGHLFISWLASGFNQAAIWRLCAETVGVQICYSSLLLFGQCCCCCHGDQRQFFDLSFGIKRLVHFLLWRKTLRQLSGLSCTLLLRFIYCGLLLLFVCHFPPLRVLFLALSVSADSRNVLNRCTFPPVTVPKFSLSCLYLHQHPNIKHTRLLLSIKVIV